MIWRWRNDPSFSTIAVDDLEWAELEPGLPVVLLMFSLYEWQVQWSQCCGLWQRQGRGKELLGDQISLFYSVVVTPRCSDGCSGSELLEISEVLFVRKFGLERRIVVRGSRSGTRDCSLILRDLTSKKWHDSTSVKYIKVGVRAVTVGLQYYSTMSRLQGLNRRTFTGIQPNILNESPMHQAHFREVFDSVEEIWREITKWNYSLLNIKKLNLCCGKFSKWCISLPASVSRRN